MPKKVYIIAGTVFLMATGYFLAIPLLSTLAVQKGFGLNEGALLIGAFVLAHKGGGLLFAPLADRWGHKRMAVMGELLRGSGLILLAWSQNFPILLMLAFFAGAGGGMSGPALNALIMYSVQPNHRLKVSSVRSMANNTGTLFGPLLAGWILLWGDLTTSFVTAGVFYLIAAISLLFIEAGSTAKRATRSAIPYLEALHNRPFLLIFFFLIGFWLLYAQLFVFIPNQLHLFTRHVEGIFLLNGIMGIALQYPISTRLITRWGLMKAYSTGALLFCSAFLLLAVSPDWLGVYGAVLLITLGEMFILPSSDLLITNLSKEENAASYFALKNLADAIGRPSGSLIGALLFERLFPGQSRIGWMVLAVCTLGLFLYHHFFLKAHLQEQKEVLQVT